MVNARIRASKSYSYLANEVGGAENLSFLRNDIRNFLEKDKDDMIESRDVQLSLNYLKQRQGEDQAKSKWCSSFDY